MASSAVLAARSRANEQIGLLIPNNVRALNTWQHVSSPKPKPRNPKFRALFDVLPSRNARCNLAHGMSGLETIRSVN